jgi:putative component of toxin-antitoxin plasmid stabilization module
MKMGFQVLEYVDEKGRSPFRSWLDCLDTATRARIQARILRFEGGNLEVNRDDKTK